MVVGLFLRRYRNNLCLVGLGLVLGLSGSSWALGVGLGQDLGLGLGPCLCRRLDLCWSGSVCGSGFWFGFGGKLQ